MTGALLQLAAMGNQDIFFTGNPEKSYFKVVYKRHSNFAMQNIKVEFEGAKSLNYDLPTTLFAKIPSYGDLLSGINLEFDIPNITKDYPFRWVKNLGSTIVNSIKIFIGTQLIETIEGEYIEIYNNTNLTREQLKSYDKLIGNVDNLHRGYRNVEDRYAQYTQTDNIPNTDSERIIVPIPFWFSKYNGQEVPLISLSKIPVKLEIELKPIKQLYHIGVTDTVTVLNSKNLNGDVINSQVNDDIITRTKFIRPNAISHKIDSWLLKPALGVNYVYLSDEESKLLKNFEHRYLIERVSKSEFLGNINESTLSVELFNPTKEVYIVPKRDDLIAINQHSNYTNLDSLDDVNILSYQNYLYKLCFDYYNKIIQKHRELSRFYSQMLNSTLPLVDNISGKSKNYYNIEPLPSNISPLYFYGLFRTNSTKTVDPVISTNDNEFIFKINGTNNTYPIINKTLEEYIITSDTQSNIKLISDINKNRISANEAPNNEDLTRLVNLWQFRDIKDIPAIDNDNYKYFNENIVKTLEIKLNGDVRLGAREYSYYNKIQPYNHHTGKLPKGVMVYSFSINPEDFQPSGACNFSNFESIELLFKLNSPFDNESLDKKNIKYDITLYTTAYNILKIENGECQLLFKT